MKTIAELAREAGWTGIYTAHVSPTERTSLTVPVTAEQIERFAALVRAQALEEAAWVPCAERLPDHGQQVLIRAGDGELAAARFENKDGMLWWNPLGVTGYEYEWTWWDGDPHHGVTHWKPYPE